MKSFTQRLLLPCRRSKKLLLLLRKKKNFINSKVCWRPMCGKQLPTAEYLVPRRWKGTTKALPQTTLFATCELLFLSFFLLLHMQRGWVCLRRSLKTFNNAQSGKVISFILLTWLECSMCHGAHMWRELPQLKSRLWSGRPQNVRPMRVLLSASELIAMLLDRKVYACVASFNISITTALRCVVN